MKFYKDKKDIITWLNQYKITGYSLVQDAQYGYVVDVSGEVNLWIHALSQIPIIFNNITGIFNCSNINVTTLEFCQVNVGGHFNCMFNELTSLEFCPSNVGGNFYCSHNQISNLEYLPQKVDGELHIRNNRLPSRFPEIASLSIINSILLEGKLNEKLTDKKSYSTKVKI